MSARRFPRWTVARRATALAFLALLLLGRSQARDWFAGSTTATTVFGALPLVDPLALLESSLASGAWMPRAALGAGLLLAAAVVLGPVFCGWVCPLGLLLDLGGGVRARLERALQRRGRHLPARVLPRGVRTGVLVAVVAFSLAAGLPAFTTVSPIHVVGRAVVFGGDPWLLALGLIALVELVAPRVWCRSLCPLGALYSLAGRHAALRVRVDTHHECRSACGLCTISCPVGVPVMEHYTVPGRPSVDDTACTRCGACLDSCPRGLLRLGFSFRLPGRDPGTNLTAVRPERPRPSMDDPSPSRSD